MKDIHKMRLAVLRELKQIQHFFKSMEKGVQSRDPAKIYPAYVFLRCLVNHMDKGDLTPANIELAQEILHYDYNVSRETPNQLNLANPAMNSGHTT